VTNPTNSYTVPSVSIATAHTGALSKANELGTRTMEERAYAKRGEHSIATRIGQVPRTDVYRPRQAE
jgi:hypothetical protein